MTEFTLYEYSAAKKAYKEKGTLLDYDSSSELYVSSELLKTSDNEGKYKIAETKTPPGYTGSWEEEVNITDKDARLSFEVVNEQEKEYTGVIRLRKQISIPGKFWKMRNLPCFSGIEGSRLTRMTWACRAS